MPRQPADPTTTPFRSALPWEEMLTCATSTRPRAPSRDEVPQDRSRGRSEDQGLEFEAPGVEHPELKICTSEGCERVRHDPSDAPLADSGGPTTTTRSGSCFRHRLRYLLGWSSSAPRNETRRGAASRPDFTAAPSATSRPAGG